MTLDEIKKLAAICKEKKIHYIFSNQFGFITISKPSISQTFYLRHSFKEVFDFINKK